MPTVLIASIFYSGHKIVSNEKKGIFRKEKAESLIKKLKSLSDLTTNPFMLDIFGVTEEAFVRYIDFVADITDAPFLIDSCSPTLKISAARHAAEIGLENRVVYNSIHVGTKDGELDNIRDLEIKAAIVLAHNPQDESANGRLEILKEILPLSEKAGITKPLIDTAIPQFGIGIGAGARAIYLVKEEYGDLVAVGTGPGNVTDTCGWVKANFPKNIRRACDASQNAIMPILGADWTMFGPAEIADYIFPAVAVIDTYIITATAELEINPAQDGIHPIFKLIG